MVRQRRQTVEEAKGRQGKAQKAEKAKGREGKRVCGKRQAAYCNRAVRKSMHYLEVFIICFTVLRLPVVSV